MLHPQQRQQNSFRFFSGITNSNPNPFLSFPQPVLISEPSPSCPGSYPYANSCHCSSTSVGCGVQEAYPFNHGAVPVASNTLCPFSNNNFTHQSLVNDVIGGIVQQSKLIQSVWCDVCNIDCNSKDVYENHILGKKHQRNLQLKKDQSVAAPESSNTVSTLSLSGPVGSIGQQMVFGASVVAPSLELEIKRQSLVNGGAAVGSIKVCTICNVACNSWEVFSEHLAGKKHSTQVGLISLHGVGPHLAAMPAKGHTLSKRPKKVKVHQSAWCHVCNINCNNTDAYAKHLVGKKHQKNLEKLDKSRPGICNSASTSAPTALNPFIGPAAKPEANNSSGVDMQELKKGASQSQASKEDLEIKKWRVMEGGAAAAAIRVCTVCNVVCNSQKVFDIHLAGRMHISLVKKQQAEAGMPIATSTLL